MICVEANFKIYKHPDRAAWFVADESGSIVIDGLRSLDTAIIVRLNLIARAPKPPRAAE
jgi:hypothetical protein